MRYRRALWTLLLVEACGEPGDPCTGTCECRIEADCDGAHAVCDDQIASRVCGCAAASARRSPTWGVVMPLTVMPSNEGTNARQARSASIMST